MKQPALLNLTQAGERFAVTRFTIWRWIEAGRLPAVQLPSGRRVVLAETVDKLLAPGRLD